MNDDTSCDCGYKDGICSYCEDAANIENPDFWEEAAELISASDLPTPPTYLYEEI
jgi:hypothetical protein